jgi:hypothetical protein
MTHKVLIVSKTVMKKDEKFCVGGLIIGSFDSVRLLDVNGNNPRWNTPYKIGQVWDMTLRRPANLTPPHVEDMSVITEQPDKPRNITAYLRTHTSSGKIAVYSGGVMGLYGSLLQVTGGGSCYIEAPRIPTYSTGFWIADQDLILNDKYYICGQHRISYVGEVPGIPTIPRGTLIRVSLARWWVKGTCAPRCYLQLSGWYL